MWSRRAQEYDQKINSGEIYQIAEVVRDLNKNTEIPVDQSYSERQLFEKAYDRFLGEVAIGMQLSNEDTKKKFQKKKSLQSRLSLKENEEDQKILKQKKFYNLLLNKSL